MPLTEFTSQLLHTPSELDEFNEQPEPKSIGTNGDSAELGVNILNVDPMLSYLIFQEELKFKIFTQNLF